MCGETAERFTKRSYQQDSSDVLRALVSSAQGLSSGEGKNRLAEHGPNRAPVLQWIFKTEPLTVEEWVRVSLLSLTVVLVVEIDKWLRRRREHA